MDHDGAPRSPGAASTWRRWPEEVVGGLLKAIRSYWFRFEADLARIALEGAGIPATVLGVDLTIAGAIGNGVQLLVPEDCVQAALQVLAEFEERR